MVDITIDGIQYKIVLNKNLFNCYNVLFMGYIFIENKRYKKYIGANKNIYLLEV